MNLKVLLIAAAAAAALVSGAATAAPLAAAAAPPARAHAGAPGVTPADYRHGPPGGVYVERSYRYRHEHRPYYYRPYRPYPVYRHYRPYRPDARWRGVRIVERPCVTRIVRPTPHGRVIREVRRCGPVAYGPYAR